MKGEVVKTDYLGFLTAITEIMAARAQYTDKKENQIFLKFSSPRWAGIRVFFLYQ